MIRYITIGMAALLLFPQQMPAQSTLDSPQQSYQQALQLFQEGLYAEAVPIFRAVADETNNPSIAESAAYYVVLGEYRLDPDLLEGETEWYIRRHPHSRKAGELLMDVGHRFAERGDPEGALEWFERAVSRPMGRNQRAELFYQMAETAVENGEYDRARDYFLDVVDAHEGSRWAPRALYARGRLYLEQEAYADASEAFELLRESYPDDPMTRRIGTALGESYYLQARYEEAVEALEEALPTLGGETLSRAVYLIAESYNMLNELDEAQRYYRYYLNRVDSSEDARAAHYGLGWVFHKQGMYHWAADSFAQAADGDDEMARKAQYYQAANRKMSGSIRRSLEAFREFGDRFSEGVFVEEAYYEWAVTAMEVGQYVEAIEVLLPLARRAEELDSPGRIISLLGEAYYGNAEYTLALEAFEIADEVGDIDPAMKLQARFQRAWVQYSNQAYAQAQPTFEQVFEEASSDFNLRGEALFWSADSHFEQQAYGPAARQYARFIDEFPDHELAGAARYALGWSYFQMGDFANAIDPFVDFMENYEPPSIALFPYDTDVRLRIGDSYFAIGEYESAMDYYNQAIGAEPGGDYAMFQVANSYYRMNRNFEAVTEFRRVLRIYPYSSLREQAQYNVAYIYMNTGNYDQAIQEFTTVIERYPDTEWAARSQYNIGDAYYNAGQFEEAIRAYRQVLEQYPQSRYVMEAIDGIQFSQLSDGGDDTSTELLEEFLADNPGTETADRLRYRRAMNRYQSGDYEAAVDEFRQYIRITNRDDLIPDAWFNLADSQLRMNRTDDAIESYRRIVNDFGDSDRAPAAFLELGSLMIDRGEYDRASEYYDRLLDRGGQYRNQAYLGLGESALRRGDHSSAQEYYEQILSEEPEHAAAGLGLANVNLAAGRYERARELAREIADRSSGEQGAEALYVVGRSYQEERQYEAAQEAYSQVSVLFEPYIEWVSMARYRRAEIYILQDQRGDATRILEELVNDYPGTEAADRASRLLNRN